METFVGQKSALLITAVPQMVKCLSYYRNNDGLCGFQGKKDISLVGRHKAPTKRLRLLCVSVPSCFHSQFKDSENEKPCS